MCTGHFSLAVIKDCDQVNIWFIWAYDPRVLGSIMTRTVWCQEADMVARAGNPEFASLS